MTRIALTLLALVLMTNSTVTADEHHVFIGTYTQGESASEGIYHGRFDDQTGELKVLGLAAKSANPSFLAVHPTGKFLFAVSELGGGNGAVRSYSIEPEGSLQPLSTQASEGDAPCHLVLDQTAGNVLLANYSSGTVAVLPVTADGHLRPASSVIRHKGSSVNKQRQAGPHAHSIHLSPDNRFALAADLGADQVFVYRFDAANGLLKQHGPPSAGIQAGGGPRHMAWHPGGRFLYVNSELSSAVTVMEWDPESGTLKTAQTISSLPDEFEGANTTAEILVHPSGRYVYCSNRGHDSIAVFRTKPDGTLEAVEHESTGGRVPRNFLLAPGGRFLLAANQESDSIVVFRIDNDTGSLEPTGQQIEVPRPVCIRTLAVRK